MKRFEGIFTVMLTACDEGGGIDRAAQTELTRYLVDSGVHGLVALGSNGECPYLTPDLQRELLDIVVTECGGAVPVIAGINERGTEPAVEAARYAEAAGADGLLVALHAFYSLEEDSVFRHYERVCGAVGIPVLYYNYPAATNLTLAPAAIARLAEIDNLVGAKETIFNVGEVEELVKATGEEFCVLSGMTFNLVPTMAVGACGAICPLPNIIPEKAVLLYEAIVAGDSERALAAQNELFAFVPLLATSPTPHAMLKHALGLLGHPIRNDVKGPLPQLTDAQAKAVEDNLRRNGLIQGVAGGR